MRKRQPLLALSWDLDALPYVMLEDYRDLPDIPAIYFVRKAVPVFYIGATRRLCTRFTSHDWLSKFLALPPPVMVAWLPMPMKPAALRDYELHALTLFRPTLNRGCVPYPLASNRFTQDDHLHRAITLQDKETR